MAHSSRGSSSSPTPSTSSSQSSMSAESTDSMVQGVRYRREDVVDGNNVRILETARRRHIPSKPLPERNIREPQHRNYNIRLSEKRPAATKQPAIVHQSKSAPDKEALSRIRNDSFIDIASAVGSDLFLPSREPPATFIEYVDLSPPPTPRFQRLPTPDLEPLDMEGFCDCCGCYAVSEHSMKYRRQFSEPSCPSS